MTNCGAGRPLADKLRAAFRVIRSQIDHDHFVLRDNFPITSRHSILKWRRLFCPDPEPPLLHLNGTTSSRTPTAITMSNSVGSDVFFLGSLLAICLVVLLLLRYYLPLRTTPAYVLIPVFLAIALPASIVLLVPIDLASTAGTDTGGNRGIWLPHRAMLVSWRITYWLTFALTW